MVIKTKWGHFHFQIFLINLRKQHILTSKTFLRNQLITRWQSEVKSYTIINSRFSQLNNQCQQSRNGTRNTKLKTFPHRVRRNTQIFHRYAMWKVNHLLINKVLPLIGADLIPPLRFGFEIEISHIRAVICSIDSLKTLMCVYLI